MWTRALGHGWCPPRVNREPTLLEGTEDKILTSRSRWDCHCCEPHTEWPLTFTMKWPSQAKAWEVEGESSDVDLLPRQLQSISLRPQLRLLIVGYGSKGPPSMVAACCEKEGVSRSRIGSIRTWLRCKPSSMEAATGRGSTPKSAWISRNESWDLAIRGGSRWRLGFLAGDEEEKGERREKIFLFFIFTILYCGQRFLRLLHGSLGLD